MKGQLFTKRISIAVMAMSLLAGTLAAQTRVVAPRNKYKVSDDVQLGQKAANDVERQFPLINDPDAQAYLSNIGDRLVAAIPAEFQHNEFNYRFRWVNASDLNAFALPGGPMYVNRGMIENARNEGELAGVMAHELSHVALRHATAQATKQSSAGSTLRTLGLILGGAVVGGQAGAELGAMAAQGFMLKYSREYESQADMLGAQIMARAGYDPQDLANVFRTIQSQGGSGGPTWMSSHPDPGNRYQKISQEAQYLRVQNPIKITRDFSRIQERFRAMPRARSMEEIEKGAPTGNNGGYDPSANGRYSSNVPYPSTRYRSYNEGNLMTISMPDNWQEFGGQSSVQFAPEGAYGQNGITRGVMLGIESGSGNLSQDTQTWLNGILQSNNYLRQDRNFSRTTLSGRQAYVTTLAGQSPITRRNEIVTVYTTMTRNGQLVYIAFVAPENEAYGYSNAFRTILNSVRFYD